MKGFGVRGVGYALAVALLAATSSISITVAQAQQSAQSQFTFNIPAKPVTQAVNDIGRITGLSVVFRENQAINANGNPVRGSLTPQQALSTLLAGTGLTYRFSNASTVQIYDPSASAANGAPISEDGSTVLDTIVVQGQRESAWGPVDGIVATRSATGMKTDATLLETPQTVNVVTADEIRNRGARSVSDAVAYTPGVAGEANGPLATQDVVFVRGFPSFQGQYLDGLVTPSDEWGAPIYDPFMFERVEVLKGPGGSLYGQTQPGGIVNMVSKRPTETPVRQVEVTGSSYNGYRGAFDFGGPIPNSDTLFYRLVGVGKKGDAQSDFYWDKRLALAPSLMWKPDDATSLTIFGTYQRDDSLRTGLPAFPAYGTILPNVNGPVSRSLYTGEPDWEDYKATQYSLGYSLDHSFDSGWRFRQNVRYGVHDVKYKQIGLAGISEDQKTVYRSAFDNANRVDQFAADNNISGNFETGPVVHNLLAGFDYRRHSSEYTNYSNYGGVSPLDLYNPVYGIPFDMPSSPSYKSRIKSTQAGLYLQDQLALDKWRLTLTGRYDWAESETVGLINTASSKARDSEFSWRAGLSYQFDSGFAPFVSYGTTFVPNVGSDYFGNAFAPTTGDQFEVGLKYQPAGFKGFISAAFFNINQDNILTTDTDHLAEGYWSTQVGSARSRGFEIEGKAEVFDNFNVIASYAYLDAVITENNDGLAGKPLPFTPRHQASLWADYLIDSGTLAGLKIGAGVRYTSSYQSGLGSTFVTDFEMKPRALVDASLHYDFGYLKPELKGTQLSLSATNVFDKQYIQSCSGGANACWFGRGRTVSLTLRHSW